MEGIPGMSNHKKLYSVLIIGLLLFTYTAQADWQDRFTPARLVPLSEILNSPQAWLDIPVRIPIRFSRIGTCYNHFFTQFNNEQYINFAAWDIQTHIWNPDGFANDYPFFYIEKDNPEVKTFLKLRPFDTICVLAKVTSIFRNKPFIRIVWLCHLEGRLHIDNLRLLHLGMKQFRQRNFEQAIGVFNQVFPTNPPVDISLMLHKTIAKIYMYEKKQYDMAIQELEKARCDSQSAKDIELNELYDRCTYYIEHPNSAPPAPVTWEEDVEKKVVKEEPKKAPAAAETPIPAATSTSTFKEE